MKLEIESAELARLTTRIDELERLTLVLQRRGTELVNENRELKRQLQEYQDHAE